MNKYLYSLVVLTVLTACADQYVESYNIQGSSAVSVLDGSKLYRVNPTGNGGTAAPSEILWFSAKDGKQIEKVGFFGIPKNVKLMDLPGRRSHEYFPRLSPDGKWLVWGATDKGHDHDIFDYELYIWKIGEPVETATRITYHTGNDRWPDIWLGKVPVKETPAKAVEAAQAAVGAAVAGGVSEAKMDELIQAINRLTDAVKALSGEKASAPATAP